VIPNTLLTPSEKISKRVPQRFAKHDTIEMTTSRKKFQKGSPYIAAAFQILTG